jgi:hypothetical protein
MEAIGRRLAVALAAAAAIGPAAASAHGVGERYDLPTPLAHFIIGATATVALSFLVTALVAGGRGAASPRRAVVLSLGPSAGALRAGARIVGVALLALVVWAGLAGDQHPVRNIVPTLVWVVWWVGLSFVAAFVGNVWAALDPWRALFDGASALARRAGGRRLTLDRPYPRALGAWPAAVLLLAFAWAELVDMQAVVPRHVMGLALGWTAVTLAGMVCFGAETWQARADPFARYFATLGRFAPLGAAGNGRHLVLRPLGRGLLEPAPALPGRAAFVIAMLATVLFDGLLGTTAWRWLERALDPSSFPILDREGTVLASIALAAVWLALLGAYRVSCGVTARLVPGAEASGIASAFALALVPIAVAYHVAHNLAYLLLRGQELIPLASDPLGRGWNLFGSAGWTPNPLLVGARFEWYVAVGAVVGGHVMSIWLAHRLMLRLSPAPRRAAIASLPLTVLMIGYTALSLWVIADPLARFRTPDPPYSRLPAADAVEPRWTSRSGIARMSGESHRIGAPHDSEPDDEVDLHGAAHGQCGDAYGRAGGQLPRREMGGVLSVDGGIVVEAREVDPDHDGAAEARPGAPQHRLEVPHHLSGLGHGAPRHQRARARIHAELPGDEEIVTRAHGVAVRCRGRRGRRVGEVQELDVHPGAESNRPPTWYGRRAAPWRARGGTGMSAVSRRQVLLGLAAVSLVAAGRAGAQGSAPASAGPPDPALLEDLVAANRILADQGVVDGYGHVSVRHNSSAERYLTSAGQRRHDRHARPRRRPRAGPGPDAGRRAGRPHARPRRGDRGDEPARRRIPECLHGSECTASGSGDEPRRVRHVPRCRGGAARRGVRGGDHRAALGALEAESPGQMR